MCDEIAGDGERLGASDGLSTIGPLPPAAQSELALRRRRSRAMDGVIALSELPSTDNSETAPRRKPKRARSGAVVPVTTKEGLPPTDSPSTGREPGGEAQAATVPVATGDLLPPAPVHPDTIGALVALQRHRRFCIVSQSRCDRSCEAYIVTLLGLAPEIDPAATKAERRGLMKPAFRQASIFRRKVEAGGEGQVPHAGQLLIALSAAADVARNSAMARAIWDKERKAAEREMERLARTLPAFAWADGVRGFGALSLAIIVGEAGDLAGYATKERLWKRLGLAVINGIRQRRVEGQEALAHGFNPKRRAEVYSIGSLALFFSQWRGAKDDAPAHAIGPYGEVYGRRKAWTEGREWSGKHRDNDARRIMTKALVEDLWRVWNGKPPLAGQREAAADG